MSGWASASEKQERPSEAQAAAIAARHERLLADEGELRRLEREERGERLTLEGELREIVQSTDLVALRERRIWECLGRRDVEIRLAHLERGDAMSVWINAYCRGLRWHPQAEEWLPSPGVLPGRTRVALRRTDSHEPFTYVTARRGDLSPQEEKEWVKAWCAADPTTRGPDPVQTHVLVTPDAGGTFVLPFNEAVKCWRQFRLSNVRVRNRRAGLEHGRPIVEENTPAAAYTPVAPIAAEDLG